MITGAHLFDNCCEVIRVNDPDHYEEFRRLAYASFGDVGTWLDEHYGDGSWGSWLPRSPINLDYDLATYFTEKRNAVAVS